MPHQFARRRARVERQCSWASRTTASSTFVTQTRAALSSGSAAAMCDRAIAAEGAGRDALAVVGAEPQPIDVAVAIEPGDLEVDLRAPARGRELGRRRDTRGYSIERDVLRSVGVRADRHGDDAQDDRHHGRSGEPAHEHLAPPRRLWRRSPHRRRPRRRRRRPEKRAAGPGSRVGRDRRAQAFPRPAAARRAPHGSDGTRRGALASATCLSGSGAPAAVAASSPLHSRQSLIVHPPQLFEREAQGLEPVVHAALQRAHRHAEIRCHLPVRTTPARAPRQGRLGAPRSRGAKPPRPATRPEPGRTRRCRRRVAFDESPRAPAGDAPPAPSPCRPPRCAGSRTTTCAATRASGRTGRRHATPRTNTSCTASSASGPSPSDRTAAR